MSLSPKPEGGYVFVCSRCGSERFRAGEIVPSVYGGFDVMMPCAQCGQPNCAIHDEDPQFAEMLIKLFETDKS